MASFDSVTISCTEFLGFVGSATLLGKIVPDLNQEMNDQPKARWLTLLAALGLLCVGIDRIFFDRIVGDDPLANIEKALSIVVGCLLSALGIGLFVAALRERFPVTAMNSIKGRLLTHAFCAALSAFVCGFCLVRSIKPFDIPYFTVMVLFGVSLISDLLWTRREVRRLAVSETAKKHATQFLWSCIFFSMISSGFGMALSGFVLSSTDFIRMFGAVFWSAITGVAIYPVLRDTKRLADAAGSSQTNHANGRGSN
ncbi:hypothetical protein [Bradyrhizobium sp. Ash2021]|uniref:hypothetical protein n=1 Tax=Bradyrhizobium sp. Ash2021 TaxID=2954771 RepID=UPI0028163D70|nr:hypothetical protein [Bradyrhizobium sp. Ash2021]WMT73849.1 hypothetical protein NL528_39005 [Bradyrhizobium sp. Ash2021]